MLKIMYMLCITVMLAGCSIGTNTPVAEETREDKPDQVVKDNPYQTQPQYIDERDYEGDELGIVRTMNSLIKAIYENDASTYNSLVTEGITPANEENSFSKYYISINKLDFSVKPDPAPPKDIKPVVLEYTEQNYGIKDTEEEKQLFLFRFENGIWKLHGIADYW